MAACGLNPKDEVRDAAQQNRLIIGPDSRESGIPGRKISKNSKILLVVPLVNGL